MAGESTLIVSDKKKGGGSAVPPVAVIDSEDRREYRETIGAKMKELTRRSDGPTDVMEMSMQAIHQNRAIGDIFLDFDVVLQADGQYGPYTMAEATRLEFAAKINAQLVDAMDKLTRMGKRLAGSLTQRELDIIVRDLHAIILLCVDRDKADEIMRRFRIQYEIRLAEWGDS